MASRIYTRKGDGGETGFYGDRRGPKDCVRIEAYGTLDELNACLGHAAALSPVKEFSALIFDIQRLLLELGSCLADPGKKSKLSKGLEDRDVVRLEEEIDRLNAELPPLEHFIVPAGLSPVTALQVARAVCRRAERRCVTLKREEPETPAISIRFINRLADLLFVLARATHHRAGGRDIEWRPRAGG